MIPSIIHQVWIGKRNPPPWRYLETWQKLADDMGWEYRLWTDDNLPDLQFARTMYDEWENVHARGNLLEYEVLYRYGGVYFDADYVSSGRDFTSSLPLTSDLLGTTEHDPLVERPFGRHHNPRVGHEIEMSVVLQPGFLASAAGHPQLRHWLELSQSVYTSVRNKGLRYWLVREPKRAIHGWKAIMRSPQICGAFHLSRHLRHPITIVPLQWLLQGQGSIARYFVKYPHQLPKAQVDRMFEMMERGEPNWRITQEL